MPRDDATAALLRCCGSREWAVQLVDRRPFKSVLGLRRGAREIWWNLPEEHWLQAFASHPRIGDRAAATRSTDQTPWARGEQEGALDAEPGVRRRLAEANEAYAARFGFIFIVCATGKSAQEMLEGLESRLGNDRNVEIRLAGEQQMQITEIRLNKLLDELEQHV